MALGIPLWKTALTDWLTALALTLLGAALLVQAAAIGGVFWSRARFGSHFDPKIYTVFAAEKSNASVLDTFGWDKAMLARRQNDAPVHDEVTVAMDKAGREMDQARLQQDKLTDARKEAEKKAALWLGLADTAIKNRRPDVACERIQGALDAAPDYMPAIRKLALLHEQQRDFAQAAFQWQKASGIAPPDSPEMREIHENLARVSLLRTEADGNRESVQLPDTKARAPDPDPVPGVATPNTAFLTRVTRTDFPLENAHDLIFHLQIGLGSHGAEPAMDIQRTRVEVDFFDQSTSAGGKLIPIKVKSTVLQPRQAWSTGNEQILTLKYTLPRGYLREKARAFGDSYAFCGFVVRVYYRGQLRDIRAQPAEILQKYAGNAARAVSGL